jgi:hypothetical protein
VKRSFGALLCMALGAVLIVSGLSDGNAGVIGGATPTCQVPVGVAAPCPTGTISLTEVTHQLGTHLTLPVGGWKVEITSPNCTEPNGTAVATTLTIPDGGTISSAALFVFTSPAHSTSCNYALAETPVTGFTTVLAPPSPVTIVFAGANVRSVTVTNTSDAATPTPTPTHTATPTPTPTPTPTHTASTPAGTGQLASTGPSRPVRPTVYLGIALCAFGLLLLVVGRRRRNGARTS